MLLLESTTQTARQRQPNAVAELLTERLLDALQRVATIIDPKAPQSLARLVRLRSTGDKLTVSAVNLTQGIFYAKTIPVWHGWGEFDLCTFHDIATSDLADAGLGHCTIRHDETGNINFFFGGSYIYEPNSDRVHISRYGHRFRVKYIAQPGAEFPAPPICADVPAAKVDAKALRRAIDFAADGCDKQAHWDAAKMLHITLDADTLTIRGTSGDALHKSIVPCVRLVDRAVTLAVWPDAFKKLITAKDEITLYVDSTDLPTQVAVKLDDGTLALVHSHADRLRGIDEDTARLWTLEADALTISTAANNTHRDTEMRIGFAPGTLILHVERAGDEQREVSVLATGAYLGERQIVVSASLLKKAFKHFDKAPLSTGRGKKRQRDLIVTLHVDALHPVVIWSAREGNVRMYLYHKSLEAMFPIVGMPARPPKYPVSFDRRESDEEEQQRRDLSAALRDYHDWVRLNLPLDMRVEIDDRRKRIGFENWHPFGRLGEIARNGWHKPDDGEMIAAYEATYGEAAPHS